MMLIDSCYPGNIYCYLTRFCWSHDAHGGSFLYIWCWYVIVMCLKEVFIGWCNKPLRTSCKIVVTLYRVWKLVEKLQEALRKGKQFFFPEFSAARPCNVLSLCKMGCIAQCTMELFFFCFSFFSQAVETAQEIALRYECPNPVSEFSRSGFFLDMKMLTHCVEEGMDSMLSRKSCVFPRRY